MKTLSGCFLGIGPLGCCQFLQGARNPYQVVCSRARFFVKTLAQKIVEMGQK